MARRETRSDTAFMRLKSDHRRVKVLDREDEVAHASKRRERRVEQHWAALVAEESAYRTDRENAF